MKMYPTEKQDKYLKDIIYGILNNLNFIEDGFCRRPNKVKAKKAYAEIKTNKEVSLLIENAMELHYYVQNFAQSAKDKHIQAFHHLVTTADFMKNEKDFEKLYKIVAKYFQMPRYSRVVIMILGNIKQVWAGDGYFENIENKEEFKVSLQAKIKELFLNDKEFSKMVETFDFEELAIEIFKSGSLSCGIVDGEYDMSEIANYMKEYAMKCI